MYLKARLAVVVFAFAFAVPSLAARQTPAHPNVATDSNIVLCHVLEAHASAEPAVLVVIFPSAAEAGSAAFGSLAQGKLGFCCGSSNRRCLMEQGDRVPPANLLRAGHDDFALGRSKA
jgi:hypothetical protein